MRLLLLPRAASLIQLITFDPWKAQRRESQPKEGSKSYDGALQQLYFTSILVQKEKFSSFMNLQINISKINVYFPTDYINLNDMVVVQLKNVQLVKREHEQFILDQQGDDSKLSGVAEEDEFQSAEPSQLAEEEQMAEDKKQPSVYPIQISSDSFKLQTVKNYQWEDTENIFLQNYNRVIQNSSSSSPEQRAEERPGEQGIETFFETQFTQIQIYKTQQEFRIGTKSLNRNYSKKIYPCSSRIALSLPFIIVNLSVKQLFLLQYLSQVWTQKSENLFDQIQVECVNKAQPAKKPGNLSARSSQSEMLATRSLVRTGAQDSTYRVTSSVRPGLLAPERRPPQQNVFYEGMQDILDNLVLTDLHVQVEGVAFNLLVNSMEQAKGRQLFHNNNIVSLFLEGIDYSQTSRFFLSEQTIQIQQFLIQNTNCFGFPLKDKLFQFSAEFLARYATAQQQPAARGDVSNSLLNHNILISKNQLLDDNIPRPEREDQLQTSQVELQ